MPSSETNGAPEGLDATRPTRLEVAQEKPPAGENAPVPGPEPEPDETRPVSVFTAAPVETNGSLEETLPPIDLGEEPAAPPPPPVEPELSGGRVGLPGWIMMTVLGLITLVVIALMSAFGGYRSGTYERNLLATGEIAGQLREQYDLAIRDMQDEKYELAIQRFEWLIRQEPNYPGVTDILAQLYLITRTTATPTLVPTPTLTPTPDLRSVEELYTQAQIALAAEDWTNAIDTLLKLRMKSPELHAVEVDGMLYVALTKRGIEKIQNRDLEGGIYDLAQAERFGPLEAEARNYRQWSEAYITGASFWEVDWARAVSYFRELATAAPYLTDASGWTSMDRYRQALVGYGDWLARQGLWCEAQEQYELALEMTGNPTVEPTATHAAEQCENPTYDETPEGEQAPVGEGTPPPPDVTLMPPPELPTETLEPDQTPIP